MIEQIKEALANATQGPWKSVTYMTTEGWEVRAVGGEPITGYGSIMQSSQNAHLIAQSPTYLRYLLEELDKANNAIVDKNAHIEGLTVAKEIEIENHTQSCFDYQDQIIKKDNELTTLRSEHTAMREALEWYGDLKNHEGVISNHGMSAVDSDFGKRANDILSTLTCTP